MRVNLNSGTVPGAESSRNGAQNPVGGVRDSSTSNLLGHDQARLSGAPAHIQALAAQAAQMPEVRQERVQVLRQAVESGNYHPGADQVAAALLSHIMVEPAV